ncbi:trypsin-like serine peptidase, partial [Acidobacteriota bacterium]
IHKTRQIEENRKRGIWYEDHRMDCFGITDERVKRNAKCVAAIVFERYLIDEKNGFSTLKVKNYGKSFNLYEGEAFREQPVAAGKLCTGFLVKKDVIATAGHCACEKTVTDLRIVFGYKMSDPYTPVTQVPYDNIYKGVKIIHKVLNREVNKSDWALVQLDREVEGQEVVTLSKDEVPCDQPVYVMGHPSGLPLKYAPGAKVRGFEDAFFTADLDTYMGSSGSPVFNDKTHEVIGIVVHGDLRDFRWMGGGWGSIIYPHREIDSKGPHCTKVSEFIAVVDAMRPGK